MKKMYLRSFSLLLLLGFGGLFRMSGQSAVERVTKFDIAGASYYDIEAGVAKRHQAFSAGYRITPSWQLNLNGGYSGANVPGQKSYNSFFSTLSISTHSEKESGFMLVPAVGLGVFHAQGGGMEKITKMIGDLSISLRYIVKPGMYCAFETRFLTSRWDREVSRTLIGLKIGTLF